MEKTLSVINDLESSGLIRKYAIGGAIGLLFHAEPVTTYDLAVFCFLPETSQTLITLTPLSDELKKRGYVEDKEHILIEGMPVQFLPAYNDLIVEAVENAMDTTFKGIRTRVLRLEYLLAIMLQTGRAKDKARLLDVIDQVQPDMQALNAILAKHQLTSKWQEWVKS